MAALEGPENVMATALGLALGLFGPMWGFCVPFVRFRAGRRFRRGIWNFNNINRLLVGAPRFELGTPSPPDWCANRAALRSARMGNIYAPDAGGARAKARPKAPRGRTELYDLA